ncbi:MAG TPA: AsmA-like C-terminal region-containing protein [Lacunisphaera sp.]
MKPARLLLILLGLLLVLSLALGGLALTPAVQRWAVLRAVRGEPGLRFEVTTVAAGLSRIRLDGLRAEKGGLAVQLAQLEADYSLSQLLFRRRLVISRLSGSGLVVDASRLAREKTAAAAAGAPAAAPGVMTQVSLPFALVLDDCLIEGRALLPGSAGGPPVTAEYKITGGRFSPGQEGTLVLAATLQNPAPSARVATLRTTVTLRARQTEQMTFNRVSLTAVVDAEGRNLSGEEQLKIAAELGLTAAGENYGLTVDTLIRGTAENVLAVHAALPAGGKEYAGDWRLLARTAQLEPFFLGAALPDFNARGEGRFTFNPTNFAASLQGGLTGEVSRLEVLEPAWRAIGAVKVAAQFDLAEADGVARLNQLNLTLAGEQPVLALSAARAAEINFKERRLQVGGSTPGEALTLTLHGLPLAWVRPFVSAADVSGGLITGQLAITGESDRLLLRSVQPLRIGQLNLMQSGELLLTKADVALAFEAVLTRREMEAAVSEFTLKTPAGDTLSARAKVVLPVGPDPSISVVATYQADLPALLAPWLPLGHIKAAGEADLTLAGERIELRRLQAGLTDAAGLDLFKAVTLRPFAFDLATRRTAVTGVTGAVELARVALGRVPLSMLPLSQPGSKLGGFVTAGELVLAVDGDKLTVRAPAALRLSEVSLTEQGRPALTGLQIEARPVLELTGQAGVRLQSGDITVRTAGGTLLLAAKGEATQSAAAGLQGAMTFTLEVPALAAQPMFAGTQAVSAGRASGELRAALGPVNQLEARMTVNGLVTTVTNETLPVANLSFRAVAQSDGKISVQAPLLLDRAGQRSDLGFTMDLTPAGRGFALQGRLAGEHIELADALAVLGVFLAPAAGAGEKPVVTTTPAKVVADAAPAWSRFTGRLALDIKSVDRGTDWSMTGLSGLVLIEPDTVALQQLEATFGEKGRLAAKARVGFTRGAQPYDLTGDFSLTEFDAGRLFKALEPAKPATIEGVFTVNGRFTGRGETLARTLERSHGTFDLTSRAGVFRGLQRTTTKISMTSKAVELGASVLGSIFGSEKVTKTAEKVAGQAYFVDQLAQSIGELPYDQLSVKLARDESLNVTLEDISLVSPDIRLIGRGTVTHVVDKPLLEQPLSASLTIAGRGKLEELFGKLRLLNGAKDDLGYAKTKETVTLGGTLLRPDPTAFFTRIATAKLGDMLAPEN